MKNVFYLALFGAAVIAALTVFDLDTALLGQDILSSSDLPWNSVPNPDVNSAAGGAEDAANKGVNEVDSWSPNTWRILIILAISGGITFLLFRSPKLRYILLGMLAATLLIVAFV